MMKIHKKHWTKTMFVDKADLWLRCINDMWKHAPRTVRQIKKILKVCGITKGRVLELGCGNGRILLNLAKLGYNVTGVDISQPCIEDARRRASSINAKTNFICGDFRKIEKLVSGKFDVVISIWTSIGFYDQRTDEKMFKKAARLLKKNGVFLILNTMSRERLLHAFCPSLYNETNEYLQLNKPIFDKMHSILHNTWVFYRKIKKDLIYENELSFCVRIYAMHELVQMAEKAGLSLKQAYDSILSLQPAGSNSPANLVFQKK